VSDTHVRFAVGDTVLISRLIDETYPNYESVIPGDNTKVVTVGREGLISSIRRVALYASATTHQVRLQIGGESLDISAQDVDFGGEAAEKLACSYRGEPMEIGFNSVYMVDILSHLEGDQVEMRFSTPTKAGIIAPAGSGAEENVIMLVMPVRLAG
jgi:DNA polymerase-3 subunit beta